MYSSNIYILCNSNDKHGCHKSPFFERNIVENFSKRTSKSICITWVRNTFNPEGSTFHKKVRTIAYGTYVEWMVISKRMNFWAYQKEIAFCACIHNVRIPVRHYQHMLAALTLFYWWSRIFRNNATWVFERYEACSTQIFEHSLG